ncbi:hypothetical protein trd_1710 [Thermomicrobium roseum DSM 5159]|uniref:Uncharacterized protein n=1 Tax=Thermomicrobium roseum (strain ATCC 27502 / DSM 5159 / P-2) TaxID=309801 RepID=B9L0Z9_THERP|nr:hypothetical protein trd_1710 [Thermomicrobium roseum DSM 5159]
MVAFTRYRCRHVVPIARSPAGGVIVSFSNDTVETGPIAIFS